MGIRTKQSRSMINNYIAAINEMPNSFSIHDLPDKLPYGIKRIRDYLGENQEKLNIIRVQRGYYKKLESGGEIKPLEPKSTAPYSNLIDSFLASFLKLSNEGKAKLVSAILPIVTEKKMLVKFDELYPNYILADAKEGDQLFHPLIGYVEIKTASRDRLGFLGNGQSWECTRNGNVIINGKVDQRRILFIDMNDYIEYMKK